jgi:hypothetical protein
MILFSHMCMASLVDKITSLCNSYMYLHVHVAACIYMYMYMWLHDMCMLDPHKAS